MSQVSVRWMGVDLTHHKSSFYLFFIVSKHSDLHHALVCLVILVVLRKSLNSWKRKEEKEGKGLWWTGDEGREGNERVWIHGARRKG